MRGCGDRIKTSVVIANFASCYEFYRLAERVFRIAKKVELYVALRHTWRRL